MERRRLDGEKAFTDDNKRSAKNRAPIGNFDAIFRQLFRDSIKIGPKTARLIMIASANSNRQAFYRHPNVLFCFSSSSSDVACRKKAHAKVPIPSSLRPHTLTLLAPNGPMDDDDDALTSTNASAIST